MTPRATYRLQFHKGFGFADAAELAPYLARLDISHVYASPYLKARPGSTHGYDIVDHDALNPEWGDPAAFGRMVAAFRQHGLEQILDFVPNHMGVGGADNPLWLDVLEWGPDSAHAGWFAIDWDPDRRYLRDKLLVPFLGDQYGIELEAGRLVLKFDAAGGSFAVWAYDQYKLPICPLDYARILGDAHPALERLGDAFSGLPEWRPQVPRRAHALKLELELAALVRAEPEAQAAIEATLAGLNVIPGQPETSRALDALIQRQHWRIAHFRVAADNINYRRFFNINDLAGIRMELPELFDNAHRLVFRLLHDGTLDGLRIDHIDGLLDPKAYLDDLRARLRHPAATAVLPGGREDPGPARAAARHVAGAGHHRIRIRQPGAGHPDRPGGRGAVHRPLCGFHRPARGLRRDRARLQDPHDGKRDGERAERAAARRRARRAAESPDRRFQPQHPAPRAEGHHRLLPGLSHLCRRHRCPHRAGPPRPRLGARTCAQARPRSRSQRLRLPGWPAVGRAGGHLAQRLQPPCRAALCDEAAAIQRPGDGQGARGHRVLSLQPLRGAERGGRPSGPVRLQPHRVSPRQCAAREALAAGDAGHLHARHHSTWAAPDAAYEAAMLGFAEAALDAERGGNFLAAFLPFATRLARLGAVNSLIQTVLKLTLPGMPDLYQDSELWDLSLVDPDNRRPVDYLARQRALAAVEQVLQDGGPKGRAEGRAAAFAGFVRDWRDGRPKLAAIHILLGYRRAQPALFAEGGYEPVLVTSPPEAAGGDPVATGRAEDICAFLRQQGAAAMLVAVARFPGRRDRLGNGEGLPDATWALPDAAQGRRWQDPLTGRRIEAPAGIMPAAALFATLPAAVLVAVEEAA